MPVKLYIFCVRRRAGNIMTGRTIIIRQVASKLSKHSNFVVTEYISCQVGPLSVLNEKNVDVSQFGVKSCERGELIQTMGCDGLSA